MIASRGVQRWRVVVRGDRERTRWLADAEADHSGGVTRAESGAHRPGAGAAVAKGVDAGGPRRGRWRPAGQRRCSGGWRRDTPLRRSLRSLRPCPPTGPARHRPRARRPPDRGARGLEPGGRGASRVDSPALVPASHGRAVPARALRRDRGVMVSRWRPAGSAAGGGAPQLRRARSGTRRRQRRHQCLPSPKRSRSRTRSRPGPAG